MGGGRGGLTQLCGADWFDPAGDAKAFKDLVLDSWLNILVLCTPIGWAAHFAGWNSYAIFILNLLSLVPLAMIIGKLTEDLATRYGDTIGAPPAPRRRCTACAVHAGAQVESLTGPAAPMLSSQRLPCTNASAGRGRVQTSGHALASAHAVRCCSLSLRVATSCAGGLLNVTFGNAVELILSIVALLKGLYIVVEYSLIGSILSNTLLVLGAHPAQPSPACRPSCGACPGWPPKMPVCSLCMRARCSQPSGSC